MIPTIIIVSLALGWLLKETDYLRIHLLVGSELLPFPERWFKTFNMSQWAIDAFTPYVESYTDNGHKTYLGYIINETLSNRRPREYDKYVITVSPNLDGTLCSKEWLDNHWNDLADYRPKVEMQIGGVKYDMTIKQPTIIKDVMKVNRLSKKQKLAYA